MRRSSIDDRHLFAVEWSAGQIHILFNLAVGGWFDHPHLPPEELSPQRLRVDYARVYKRPAAG